jgi:heme exporter protein CcmD
MNTWAGWGYGPFVWVSFGVAFLLLAIEVLLVRAAGRRTRSTPDRAPDAARARAPVRLVASREFEERSRET